MLKITWLAGPGSVQVLKLEGKLSETWVDLVRESCAQSGSQSRRTGLDLSALSFVDATGAELLRYLIRQGVAITACSSFVAELLCEEKM